MSEVPTVGEDIVYVVAAPPETLPPGLVMRVASLLGKAAYDTRLLLAGKIPRVIACLPDIVTADSMAQSMRDAGLTAFICRDSELRNCPARFVAHTVKSGERGVTFLDKVGGEAFVEASEAFLIIRGRVQSSVREKVQTTKIKLNVPMTLLTGGIPIMRRVSRTANGELIRADDFVRIYDGKSSDPRVEMLQNHMDYAFLGPDLTPSTPVNFRLVVTKLREWFPQASYDERLMRSFKTDVPVAGPEEALEINCKLISLCYLAAG
jgi:hypothetical protein